MEHMPIVIGALIPVVCLVVTGFALRRFGVLLEAADSSLMRMVVYLFYPALIFKFVLGNAALQDASNLVVTPLTGFVSVVLGFAVAYYLAPLFRITPGASRRTFAFTAGIYNFGYIPIPLIALLWNSREITGLLLVFNLGVETAFWTVGIGVISGSVDRRIWRHLFNPPIIALLLALMLNWLGIDKLVPEVALASIDMFAQCAIPLGILLAGATIADLARNESLNRAWNVLCGAAVLRLGLLPLLFVASAVVLPLSDDLKRVIIVQAAMPAAILPIVVTRFYGGDGTVAVRVVVGTSILGLMTIPVWIAFGLRLLGLE